MESTKRGQRKRKSAGVGNIFEVSDKDLSPEPEEIDNEPEAKVLKTRKSDVSESRQNNLAHNPKIEQQLCNVGPNKPELEEKHGEGLSNQNENCSNILASENEDKVQKSQDNNLSNTVIFDVNDDTLEDGEVNDVIIIDETISSPGPLEPSISIKFENINVADIYKPKFVKFIQSFIELEVQNFNEMTINVLRNTNIDPQEWIVLDSGDTPGKPATKPIIIEPDEELAKILPETPKNDSPKKKKKKRKQKVEELFIVDTNPGINTGKLSSTKYSTKFLINDEKQEEAKGISKPSALSMCFNCGKNHSLKDCPEPKNYGKINANRQKFMNKTKTSRYHLEEEQKYNHLKPGKISAALRKALGLEKNEMPSYIYQMRILGYPPGWLEEAKVVESELSMFDIDGNNVKNTNIQKIKGLDPERVVNYPGFNIPPEKDFKDAYKQHHVPPYSEDFSKEKMVDYFRKKCLQEEDDLEAQDMDLDNTVDLITSDMVEEVVEVKILQNKQLDSLIDSDSNNVPSPSLTDLEKQKKSLLEELKNPEEPTPWEYREEDTNLSNTGDKKEFSKESKESNSKDEEINKEDDKEINKEDDKEINKEVDKDAKTKEGNVVTSTVCESIETTIEIKISEPTESHNTSPITVNSGVNCVKHSTFGTPIIKSSTPYNRLPNPDNFSKGVSPVIDFENLPNSTGKYEQMTGVLQKVRDTINKLKTK